MVFESILILEAVDCVDSLLALEIRFLMSFIISERGSSSAAGWDSVCVWVCVGGWVY